MRRLFWCFQFPVIFVVTYLISIVFPTKNVCKFFYFISNYEKCMDGHGQPSSRRSVMADHFESTSLRAAPVHIRTPAVHRRNRIEHKTDISRAQRFKPFLQPSTIVRQITCYPETTTMRWTLMAVILAESISHKVPIINSKPYAQNSTDGEGIYASIHVGETFSFHCQADQVIRINVSTISKNAGYNKADFDNRTEIRNNGNNHTADFLLKDAKEPDSGEYVCYLKNDSVSRASIHLFVKGDHTFVPLRQKRIRAISSPFLIPCPATSFVQQSAELFSTFGKVANSSYRPTEGFIVTVSTNFTTAIFNCTSTLNPTEIVSITAIGTGSESSTTYSMAAESSTVTGLKTSKSSGGVMTSTQFATTLTKRFTFPSGIYFLLLCSVSFVCLVLIVLSSFYE